jgi:hypothetical protein
MTGVAAETGEVGFQHEGVFLMQTRKLVLSVLILAFIVTGLQVSASSQTTTRRTAITGPPPYELGAAMETVLSASSELRPGSRRWTSGIPTVAYQTNISASIGSVPYTANVGLNFWQGKLAYVGLEWSTRQFPSVDSWKRATADLYNQLIATYDTSALSVKKNIAPQWSGSAVLVMADSTGNELWFISSHDNFSIDLIYLWGPFAAEDAKLGPPLTPRY